MALPYYDNIPQPTDKISQSQPKILDNFGSIETLIAEDHTSFSTASPGWHNKTTFPVQGSAPSFAAGNIGLYNLQSATTSDNQLYFTDNSGNKRPLTVKKQSGLVNAGWTLLPANIFLGWGASASSVGSTFTWTVNFGFPALSNVYSVVLTGANGTANTLVTLNNYNNTGMTVTYSATPASFTFMVIGVVNNPSVL